MDGFGERITARDPTLGAPSVLIGRRGRAVSTWSIRPTPTPHVLPEVERVHLKPVNARSGGVGVLDADISVHPAQSRKDVNRRGFELS